MNGLPVCEGFITRNDARDRVEADKDLPQTGMPGNGKKHMCDQTHRLVNT